MAGYSRRLSRLFAALAVVALIQVFASPVLATRENARCKAACRATSKACTARCDVTCADLFPGTANDTQRVACVNECRATCMEERKDCKDICVAKKKQSPEDP